MTVTSAELIKARELTIELLDEIGLEMYVFEIAPTDGAWELRLDCGTDGGWTNIHVPVERDLLLASGDDAMARQQLLMDWGQRLLSCRTLKVDRGESGR
jgi:hypothetical protein